MEREGDVEPRKYEDSQGVVVGVQHPFRWILPTSMDAGYSPINAEVE